ncbi:hypothetical protein M9H77_28774 [Catharanthus roseus]|uniref:Uncharacterized protein n=1 Tax=Catharanthus roseus TaxID=4058 RepID=A0ACC0AGX5_CATRO|nr:hypothetical protein M9H77_28774 [Catharanthus roseus]
MYGLYTPEALTFNPCTVLETSRFQDFRCQPIHCTSIGDSTTTATWPATLPNPLSSSYPGPVEDSISRTMSHPKFVWNIDGSSNIRLQRAGCGGILRDEEMNCKTLFAERFDEVYTSSVTEVFAFFLAMKITQSMIKEGKLPEQLRLEIRTDFQPLAMFIRGENNFSKPKERDLAEKGYNILSSLTTDWEATQVTRSSNFVADLLAGNAHELGNITYDNLPEIIENEIENEKISDWDESERTYEYMYQKKTELKERLGEPVEMK